MWWRVIVCFLCVEMNEEFMKAVERGDSITYITCLLNMGVDINTHDEYGVCVVIYILCVYWMLK